MPRNGMQFRQFRGDVAMQRATFPHDSIQLSAGRSPRVAHRQFGNTEFLYGPRAPSRSPPPPWPIGEPGNNVINRSSTLLCAANRSALAPDVRPGRRAAGGRAKTREKIRRGGRIAG
jgi:hypothetical protein